MSEKSRLLIGWELFFFLFLFRKLVVLIHFFIYLFAKAAQDYVFSMPILTKQISFFAESCFLFFILSVDVFFHLYIVV